MYPSRFRLSGQTGRLENLLTETQPAVGSEFALAGEIHHPQTCTAIHGGFGETQKRACIQRTYKKESTERCDELFGV